MINLLIYLIIICLVLYVLWWVLSQIPLPQPIRTVAVVIFALVAVIMLLNMTGGIGSFHLLALASNANNFLCVAILAYL
jgi:hypothetical protein